MEWMLFFYAKEKRWSSVCKHLSKIYIIPAVLNTPPKEMIVKWKCASCGEGGTEKKLV